jgi:hypothetical protein
LLMHMSEWVIDDAHEWVSEWVGVDTHEWVSDSWCTWVSERLLMHMSE